MKRHLALCLFIFSSSACADEIIKIIDASKAQCSSKQDFIKYQSEAVYRPLAFVRTGESSQLTLEFLKCVETEEGHAFQREHSIDRTEVKTVARPFGYPRTLIIERTSVTLLAYNGKGRILSQAQAMKKIDGTYVADLKLNPDHLDSTFAGAKFEFSVYTLTRVTDKDTGIIIDFGREYLGSYALIVR